MQKATRGQVFGLQKHNQRENKKYKNEDVDLARSHLNYDLANYKKINHLEKIDKIIASQRKSTRAIRKDAVLEVNTIISSDNNFFKNLSEHERDRFFKESYDYLCNKIGSQNVISAIVHLDETTPHMHFSFVPMNDDGTLSAKKKINRNFLREIQEELPKFLQKKNFYIERGVEDKLKHHLDTIEYKKKQIKREMTEIDQQSKEISKLSQQNMNKFKSLKNESEILSKTEEHIKNVVGELDNIKVEKSFLGSKLILTKEGYNILLKAAKSGEGKLLENVQLKSKINVLQERINDLENEVKGKTLEDKIRDIKSNQADKFEKEIREYKIKFQRVEQAIQNLGLVDEVNKEIKKLKQHDKNIQNQKKMK